MTKGISNKRIRTQQVYNIPGTNLFAKGEPGKIAERLVMRVHADGPNGVGRPTYIGVPGRRPRIPTQRPSGRVLRPLNNPSTSLYTALHGLYA